MKLKHILPNPSLLGLNVKVFLKFGFVFCRCKLLNPLTTYTNLYRYMTKLIVTDNVLTNLPHVYAGTKYKYLNYQTQMTYTNLPSQKLKHGKINW